MCYVYTHTYTAQVKIEAAIASGLALYLRAQAKGLRAAHVEFEVHIYTSMCVYT